jgi:hypothetical protein
MKAKNYIGDNCNFKELDFKLVGGWKLINMTGWRYPPKAGR